MATTQHDVQGRRADSGICSAGMVYGLTQRQDKAVHGFSFSKNQSILEFTYREEENIGTESTQFR